MTKQRFVFRIWQHCRVDDPGSCYKKPRGCLWFEEAATSLLGPAVIAMWKVEFRSTDSCRSLCTAFLWRAVLLVAFCEWTPSVVALSGIGFLALPLKPPGYPCQDNEDCGFDTDHYRAIPCCLMVDVEHGRPVGICQPSLTLGELCAPGERLRDFYGYNVYQTSCPCHRGLRCVPAQQWYTPEMVLVNMNPTCRSPEDEDASSSSSVRTRVTTEEPSRVTRV